MLTSSEVVQSYADQLGLEMPLEYVGYKGPVASKHDPVEGKHRIYHPYGMSEADLESYNPRRPFLGNAVHELCHLYLAETIDPSFAGFETSGDETKKQVFSQIENIVVDLWVNDLFNERFPELFEAHHGNFTNTAAARIRDKEWGQLLPPKVPHSLARSEAEGARHDITQIDFTRLLQKSGFTNRDVGSKTGQSLSGYVEPALLAQFQYRTLVKLWDHIRTTEGEPEARTMDDIAVIRDFLFSVPAMSPDRDQALALHESTINNYAEMGHIALKVSVVDESPRPSWNLT